MDWEPPEYGSDDSDSYLAENFNAIIFDNLPYEQFQGESLPISWYPRNYVNWRIYTEQEYDKPYWGFNYDLQGGKRGWYLVHPRTEHDILLKQNFSIDIERIKSVDDIESAWLSLSYQFPGDAVSTRDLQMIKVGMGYWNTIDEKYVYEAYTDAILNDDNRPITLRSYLVVMKISSSLISQCMVITLLTRNFIMKIQGIEKTFRVNVTRYMKDAYRKYLNDGNPDHLRLEVAVGVRTKDTISKNINIDDIVLQVNHVQHIDGQFRFNDLMRYLEDNAGPAEGNFFHLLNELQFNASQLVGFAESTLGLRPSGSYTPTSLIRYFTTSDYSLTNMMEILNDLEKAKQTNSPRTSIS